MIKVCKHITLLTLTALALSLGACSSNEDSDEGVEIAAPVAASAAGGEKPYPYHDIRPAGDGERIHINPIGRLREVFNDSNYQHYAYAQKLGIEPIHSVKDAYFTSKPVVHVVSTANYSVDSLTHSIPFLVPQAEALLSRIGANFKDSLRARGGDGYRILVTSLLRTPQSVKRLRRVNVNSTDSSTHQFATTFDISYVRFDDYGVKRRIHQGDLKNLLGEVLLDLRKEGRCLVKYERMTGCYHVTAIK